MVLYTPYAAHALMKNAVPVAKSVKSTPWKVIDDAGMRGACLGGAQISEKHSNFLINTGTATAADLENLGELVRKKVSKHSQIELMWEIMRIGEPIVEDI